MSEFVGFVYGQPKQPEGILPDKLLPDRGLLFGMLEERGIQPLVSTHREDAFAKEGHIRAAVPEYDKATVKPGQKHYVALDDIGALVNRAGKSLQRPHLPPTINEQATRKLGHDKDRTHSEVLDPLGLGMPTQFVKTAADVERFLEEREEDNFVIKPARNPNFGKGVMVVDRLGVQKWFAEHPDTYDSQLLQPKYDFNGPFPPCIKPYDRQSADLFADHNVSGKRKELRMYGFLAGDYVDLFPVARTLDPQDEWFFIDPDSLPEYIYDQTQAVVERTADVSRADALYACVDFGYGQSSVSEPGFHIVEANLRSPYLLGTDKHPYIATALRRMFADMLERTVAMN